MGEFRLYTRADYEAAAALIRSRVTVAPQVGLILGSGLGPLADTVEDAAIISVEDVPKWPQPTVEGHAGRLVVGMLEKKPVLVLQGRVHFYEGHSMQAVVFPIRVMQMLGIHTLIVTNAAGGVNPDFLAGDLMLINDHINFIGMAGNHPLIGPNDESLGVRFLSMTRAYDKSLRDTALKVAAESGQPLKQGVYACIAGPSFETPAEVRMLRILGIDAIGMSTVPEVIAARHGGMRVLGFSTITNVSIDALDTTLDTSHEEVLLTGKNVVPRLSALLRGVLSAL
ncbi:MAG: purine-nucleoside phosphorylase [Anaerolineae bacterium]|nr:purine-nucleoside phosphorylase [Anaerolineae bacterium]